MTEKEIEFSQFNPSGVAQKNNQIFGLPYLVSESEIVILGTPWDVTTSYRDGTHYGPEFVREASYQLDLFHPKVQKAWEIKIATDFSKLENWKLHSQTLRPLAKKWIHYLESGGDENAPSEDLVKVNEASIQFDQEVYLACKEHLNHSKKVLLLGGDHSTSFGNIRAYAEAFEKKSEEISILHLDAHADLRKSYEGFVRSHASIMENIRHFKGVKSITQFGIRDYCEEEFKTIQSDSKIKTFFDFELSEMRFSGESWQKICQKIIQTLGSNVYLSFDIDGLNPSFCPNTGTPVPGGLQYEEVLYLLDQIILSGRKIVGGDLVEVAPPIEARALWNEEKVAGDDWDSNVGARMLFQMALCMAR